MYDPIHIKLHVYLYTYTYSHLHVYTHIYLYVYMYRRREIWENRHHNGNSDYLWVVRFSLSLLLLYLQKERNLLEKVQRTQLRYTWTSLGYILLTAVKKVKGGRSVMSDSLPSQAPLSMEFSSRGSSWPGAQSCIAADSLPSELPGKLQHLFPAPFSVSTYHYWDWKRNTFPVFLVMMNGHVTQSQW